jgi:hypothetical protein
MHRGSFRFYFGLYVCKKTFAILNEILKLQYFRH